MIRIFDHVLSPLKDNKLDDSLRRFQRAGFVVDDRKVRHARGRLTGFVRLTGTYLEFLSVIDEQEFNREASREDRLFRAAPQPYGIGVDTSDPEGIRNLLKPNFPEITPVIKRGSPDDPSNRTIWSMCILPRRAFPGANVFATQYHERKSDSVALHQGANTVFALGGITLCSHRAAEYQTRWCASLTALETPVGREESTLRSRGQTIEWITPAQYRALFGRDYNRFYEDLGAVAVVKLLCTDLAIATTFLEAEGFVLTCSTPGRAFFQTDINTGYTFELVESDLAAFVEAYNPVACVAV